MIQTLIYLLLFAAGVVLSLTGVLPNAMSDGQLSQGILYLLLFLVGIQIGSGKNMFKVLKRYGARIIWIPLGTTLGTFAGVALISFLLPGRSLSECLSIGSGFAYYSLSSILITEYKGMEPGTVALLANIMREFTVLIFAPRMVRYFGPLAPITAGGATTMDTTLPFITRYSGEEYVVIALFHGMVIDFSVPFWIFLFVNL